MSDLRQEATDEASIARSMEKVALVTPSSSKSAIGNNEKSPSKGSQTIVSTCSVTKRKQRSNDSLDENVPSDENGAKPDRGKNVKIRRKIVMTTSNKGKSIAEKTLSKENNARKTIVNNGASKPSGTRDLKSYFQTSTHLSASKSLSTTALKSQPTIATKVVKPKGTQMSNHRLVEQMDESSDVDEIIDQNIPLSEEGKALFKRMAKIKDKCLRFELHLEYMQKYQEAHRVPKGFRIIKDPYLGEPIEDFDLQWYECLEAASTKLLDITVEKLKYLTANLNQQWNDLESELDNLPCPEQIKLSMIDRVMSWSEKKESKLRETKNAKWERDQNFNPKQGKRKVTSPRDPAAKKPKANQQPMQRQKRSKKSHHGQKQKDKRQAQEPKQQRPEQSQQVRQQKKKKGKNWKGFTIPKTSQKQSDEEAFREMMKKFIASCMK